MKEEGPNQIKNLILEKQVNNVMFGDIFKYDDYENWSICIAEDKEKKNEQFFTIATMQVSNVFQLDASSKIESEKLGQGLNQTCSSL